MRQLARARLRGYRSAAGGSSPLLPSARPFTLLPALLAVDGLCNPIPLAPCARKWRRRYEPAHFVAVAGIILLSVRRGAAERDDRDCYGQCDLHVSSLLDATG